MSAVFEGEDEGPALEPATLMVAFLGGAFLGGGAVLMLAPRSGTEQADLIASPSQAHPEYPQG